MLASWLIGIVIFGLALLFVVRAIRLSGQGRCAGCALKERCSSGCGAPAPAPADDSSR